MAGLLQSGIGGRVKDAEDNPLVFRGRKLCGGHLEHGDGQETDDKPDQIDRRPGGEGLVKKSAIEFFEAVKSPADTAGQTMFGQARFQQLG